VLSDKTPAVFHGLKSGVAKSRFKFQALAICAALMTFAATGWGQTTNTFSTAGSTNWICPAGVTSVTVECWGGGGSGGASINGGGSPSRSGAGGGGGGAYASSSVAVVPGNTYAIVVGAGGPSGSSSTSGGDSSFNTSTVIAKGGAAGSSVNGSGLAGSAGSGGLASASTGTTKYSGGNGAAGTTTASAAGGGGGSSAGTAAAGNNASGSTAGTAPAAGAAGGAGRTSSAGDGSNASAPGGGGGGALSASSTGRLGGSGGDGRVRLTYTVAATPTITGAATATAFTTTYGTASSSQTFNISGANMSAGITVTPPTGFEVSTSSTFASNVGTSISPITVGASGTIASTPIYVRLAANAAVLGTYNSQNIVLSSTGATAVNIVTASTGNSVTAKGLTITGLTAQNKNWDNTTTASVTGTAAFSGLISGDSSLTPGGSVTWAFADANVGTNKTLNRTGSYTVSSSNYSLTQPTLTASIAAVAPSAPTITGITAGNDQLSVAFTAPTSSGGASITDYKYSIDGGALVLVGSTSSPFIITGLTNGQLYAVQLYAVNSAGNSLASSAVNGTPLAPSSPTITVAPTTFASAFNTTYGTASSTQTFTVSGSTLGADVTVTAPAGLEISLSSGSGYAGSLTLPQTSGSVSSTTIYARLKANASAGNYNAQSFSASSSGATAQSVSTTATGNVVGQATLTITGIGIANKVYDRATSATITGTAAYGGLQNGESFGVTGTPSASFAIATVGLAKPVTVTGYNAPNSNYTLTQPTLAADISAVALTVTGATVTPKSYDGNTVATIAGATLSGVISPDVVTLSGGTSGTFANANVGTGIAVSTTMGITGADAGNYSFTAPTGLVGEITKATAVITFNSLPVGKKVGDGAFSAGATTTAGTLSYSSSNPNVATVDGSGNITPVAPGVTTITANVAGTANYNAAAPASQTLNVGQNGVTRDILPKLYLTARNTPSGISNWTIINAPIDNAGTDYWKMINTTAVLTSPAFDLTPYTAASCVIKLGTFGTANAAKQTITITISTDDGLTWLPLTTRTPTTSGSTAMTAIDLSTYNTSKKVRLQFANAGGDSSTGVRFFEAYLTGTTPGSGITASGTFSALNSTYGTVSTASATTVMVTGGSLTADILATAPTGFEVSNDGATYGATATFAQTGGFANGTLYLRLAANAAAGSYDNQVVTLSSTGASNQTVAIASSTVSAGSLAGGDIALTPVGDGSYTASGPVGSTFSYSYAGRSANGINTSYSSATAPTSAGFYTVTATATGNYSGSNTADYFVAGPVGVSDAITKPAGNPSLVLTLASLLANDVRITPAGAVATDGLSITGVTNGSGNSAEIDGGDILFSPGGASPETFTYTVSDGTKSATATVTVTTESSAPTFSLQIVKVGTATFSAPNTSVTHDFIGVPNQTYAVEYSTDLTNWTSAGNRSTGATGSFSLNITKSGDVAADWNAHMFFRARLVR